MQAISYDFKSTKFTGVVCNNEDILYVDIPAKSIAFITGTVLINSISSESLFACWLSDTVMANPRYATYEDFINSNESNRTHTFASVSAYDNSDNEQSKRVYLQAYSNNCTVNGNAEISFMSVKKP